MTRYTENILRGEEVEQREMKEQIRKNDRSCSVSVWRNLPLIRKWQRILVGVNCGTPLSVLGKIHNLAARIEQSYEPPWKRTKPLPTLRKLNLIQQ